MNLESEVRIVNGIEQIIDSRGVTRFKDAITGKFVRQTGEYIPSFFTGNSDVVKKKGKTLSKISSKSVISDNIKLMNKSIKVHDANIKEIILVTVGITTLATGGAIIYRNHKIKKRAKELQQIGFEFVEEGGEEFGNI